MTKSQIGTIRMRPALSELRSARKCATLLALSLQNTALILLTKLSYGPSVPYLASTVVACAELVKLLSSNFLLVCEEGLGSVKAMLIDVRQSTFRLALPSILYVIQNNLLFEGIRLLSPIVYIVSSQSKIFTSALFSALLLGLRITRLQCIALVMLVCGVILVQKSQIARSVGGHSFSASTHTAHGTLIVFVAALTSGFAGACMERLYRQVSTGERTRSIWF